MAPDLAHRAAANFHHLLDLGFRRINLLPAYLVVWTAQQVRALHEAMAEIAETILARWGRGEALYLRNLATWSPTPFFNSGLVVDSDGSVHVSNVSFALPVHTRVGSLDAPPSDAAIDERLACLPETLQAALPARVVESMTAVDTELSRLCKMLYPAWLERHR